MLHKEIFINNKHGLHARPSSMIAEIVSKFHSQVIIKYKENQTDASSVMNLILLCVEPQNSIYLEVTGPDEQEVFDALVYYLEKELPIE